MSSITSGVGIFSGINSEQLINQLLQLDARPKTIYQKRIRDISLQQTALLDVNTRLSSLKSASTKFNTSQIFKTATTASSNADVLTATATAGAAPGTYRFTVDRLVREIDGFVAEPARLAVMAHRAHEAGAVHRSGALVALVERVAEQGSAR